MLADPAEFNEAYFGNHPLSPKPIDVELLANDPSGRSLRRFADMQAEWYRAQLPSPATVASVLDAYLMVELMEREVDVAGASYGSQRNSGG